MSNDLQALKDCALFSEFNDEILERFRAAGKTRTYDAGDIVFVEMSEGDEIYLITGGEATIQFALASEDEQYEVVTRGPGDILGEVSFIEGGQRSATVIARTTLEVIVWDCATWRRMCEEDYELGYRLVLGIAKILSQRLREWNVRILNNVSWGLV
jgi:CRP-like cAMP-binding protein